MAPLGPRGRPGRPPDPVINLVQLHTGEILPVSGRWTPRRRLVDLFLRCRWTGRFTRMDPRLLGWILEAARHFGAKEIQVVSAYRHGKFNEILRKKGREVARRSRHCRGQAVDFRLVGVEVGPLVRYLRKRRLGGVGHYPTSEFIHLDTGPVRSWGGT